MAGGQLMADYTAEQYRAAAKKALAAGDTAAAQRLIAAGRALAQPDGMSELSGAFQQAVTPRAPDAPGAYKPATARHAAVGGLLQGLTFGLGDELAARVASIHPGIDYEEALPFFRKDLEKSRQDRPYITTGAEIAGAIAAPVGAIASAGSLPLRMAKSAATTGAMSGAYGFNAGEGGFQNRAAEALPQAGMGAAVGAAIPVAGSALQSLMQSRATQSAIRQAAKGAPSSDELRAMGNALYQQVDDAGVQIAPQAFDRARGGILDDLRANTGFDELPGPGSLTPNSARANQIMGEASARMGVDPTAALPFKALDQMRRQAGAAAGNVANKTDQKAGMTIIEGLDDFIKNLGPNDVVAGDVRALQDAIPKARDVWSRMSKSQMIDTAIEAGENYKSGASSGIRQQFKNILQNKKLAARFSQAEKAAMRRVVNGSFPEQLLQLFGGGLGQLAQIGGAGFAGGIPGLVAGLGAAAGTRKLAEGVTRRKAETLRALVANGGLPNLPQASTALRDLMEQRLRLGTAASIQPR
jgi:hypothetical protein